ncbi:hypothetical protein T07_126 [Trichinella nelsoni]|uniref:Uncharacterized protein n=1 Tax=Trichinella nelsoni TaxID=6336 RepID=A0A0V0SJJ8_9BILA|nr:hypothetical protein T07_126 [Trichinella nelsoni]
MHECTARRMPSFDSNKISANDDKSPINLKIKKKKFDIFLLTIPLHHANFSPPLISSSASRRDNETLKLANFAALFFLLINHCWLEKWTILFFIPYFYRSIDVKLVQSTRKLMAGS